MISKNDLMTILRAMNITAATEKELEDLAQSVVAEADSVSGF
jgi:hypothetical protein